MKILNIRNGFACNSSSTHSIIFNSKLSDSFDGYDFGWNEFVATDENSKKMYLAHILIAHLQRSVGEELAKHAAKSFFGLDEIDGHVDHQSVPDLPVERHWGENYILNLEFFKDYANYVLQDDAIIVGGNDNDGCDSFADEEQRVYMSSFGLHGNALARKDPSGYWTLFSPKNGNKVRITFNRNHESHLENSEVHKAALPELVDLKITDYCVFDCKFCYQGSTKEGTHGNTLIINAIIDSLEQAKVFEVAIGGGEPTLHPDFSKICERLKLKAIVPNFTTRNYHWPKKHPEVIDMIGSFAISCDSRKDFQEFLDVLNSLEPSLKEKVESKVTVQHVVGIASEDELRLLTEMVTGEGIRIIFLGYKTTHRGANVSPHLPNKKSQTWSDVLLSISKSGNYRIGIDTVLAKEMEGKVPDYMLTTKEGQFSCYVDATLPIPKMYASSFGAGDGIEFQNYYDYYGSDGESIAYIRKDKNHNKLPRFNEAWLKIKPYSPEDAYDYKKKSLKVVKS